MVTLSVTDSRIRAVLASAADLIESPAWDPATATLMQAIDQAAGYQPGRGTRDGEATTIAAWTVIEHHLDDSWPDLWAMEHQPAEVAQTLREVAARVGGWLS
ncbi:hypothetical protein AB0M57_04305 [Streptomyces sp. NPDC051597]|uniref:hypothetical protein n=1 Tax=Streptomyces sp. NPDC051597 TaxID=3155049 RepID=UPI003416131D